MNGKCFSIGLVAILLFFVNAIKAQVKVDLQNDVGIGVLNPVNSAKLHVESLEKGFLKPRFSTSQLGLIANPVAGLEVYNTTENRTYWWNGSAWVTSPVIQAGSGISVSGSGVSNSPYIISTSSGSTSQNLGNVVSLITNIETAGTEFTNSTAESGALITVALPVNTFSQVIVEVVTRSRMDQDALGRPTFTWRIKQGTSTVETVVQRLVADNAAGVFST